MEIDREVLRTRKYGGGTLHLAASDLIDLYEAKALDADLLHAIATTVFGMSMNS